MQFETFSQINKYTSSRNTMLTAACAAGIVLALGTPIGGVMFSIEALFSIYIMSNIWKSFFCVLICLVFSKIFGNFMFLYSITDTSVLEFSAEIILFILQGVIGGIIGFFLNNFIARIVYLRRKSSLSFLKSRFRYTLLIALTIVIVTYFVNPLRLSERKMVSHIFQHTSNEQDDILIKDGFSLLTVWVLKIILFILSMTMNIPADVFTTLFCIGGIYGRLYGHYMGTIFNTSDKTIYSMIGAACVFSGSTQTISSAVIIFEITGKSSYLPALLLASIIANLTSQSLSMGIYDVLLAIKNLPYLPNIKTHSIQNKTAIDILSNINHCLELNKLTIINIMQVLSYLPVRYDYTIPVLDESYTLKYTVNVISLKKYIQALYEKNRMSYNIVIQKHFTDYFETLRMKFTEKQRSLLDQIKHKFNKLLGRFGERVRLNKTTDEEINIRLFQQFKESK
jgi:H+/Cl- antiporter ClcA